MAPADQPKLKRPVHTYLRFLSFLKPYIWKMLLVVLCIFAARPLFTIPQLIERAIIDNLLYDTSSTIGSRILLLLIFMAIWAASLWSSRALDTIRGFFQYFVSMKVLIDLRRKFYNHLHRLPFTFFQERPIGEHMYRCMEDIRIESPPIRDYDWQDPPRGLVDMISTILLFMQNRYQKNSILHVPHCSLNISMLRQVNGNIQ